jgi:3-deoxy-7-phosphoheptulonate synthase
MTAATISARLTAGAKNRNVLCPTGCFRRTMTPLHDVRVLSAQRLIPPAALKDKLPLGDAGAETVVAGRAAVEAILTRRDPRLLVIVGPCSIHDPLGALDYARRLLVLRQELAGELEILMRVYFEKPRTTLGWKGLINDPHLDDSCDVEAGLHIARRLLLEIVNLGLPTATEFLDSIVPQYNADLVSWAAIGARTTESQTHREMASGLSMPVGFKNGTDGNCQTAIDAMRAARHPHSFMGIDQEGRTSVIKTTGNALGHLVMRGGRQRTNYDPPSIAEAARGLVAAKLPPVLMVDCSHANSGKHHARQELVWQSLLEQRRVAQADELSPIIGAMLESYLEPGNQPIPAMRSALRYGVSITDACLGWTQTEALLRTAAARVNQRPALSEREVLAVH